MGVFDSVYVKCPHCSELNEEQFKPGTMRTFVFPDDVHLMPIDIVRSFQRQQFECWECKKTFYTSVQVTVDVSKPRVRKDAHDET